MNVSLVFASGIGATFLAALVVVAYLNLPLRKQLLELCGNEERTQFWSAFANVTLLLMPVIFAMSIEPSGPPLLAIANQLKWGSIGLVTSILVLGWVLGRFIPKGGTEPEARPGAGKMRSAL